jgi:hypothetical protein
MPAMLQVRLEKSRPRDKKQVFQQHVNPGTVLQVGTALLLWRDSSLRATRPLPGRFFKTGLAACSFSFGEVAVATDPEAANCGEHSQREAPMLGMAAVA